MKITIYMISATMFMAVSCHDEAVKLCETLRKNLVEFNVQGVQEELNEWLINLQTLPTVDDPIGHEANLESFVNRLTTDCDFEASVGCYACIETFPVQSEVYVMVDSSGVKVLRAIDIRTPPNDVMTILNVHH